MNQRDRLEVMALMELRSIPEPNTGCWLWTAASDQDGYGKTKWHGVSRPAHRLSFEAFHDQDPSGMFVMHSCDVACCVNPTHLSLGTAQQNVLDRTLKGRSLGKGGRNWNVARGATTTHKKVVVAGWDVTHEVVAKFLAYDPRSGNFIWLARPDDIGWTRKNAGKPAGTISTHGKPDAPISYVRIRVCGRDFFAHRLAWLWVNGELPEGAEIDHINGDTLDNRIANLRLATRAQNGANQGLRRNNTSGVKGVSWDAKRGRWFASITIEGKSKALGRFDDFDDAVAARKAAEDEHHGVFAHIRGNA